jgi:uncharacterized membrane protein
MDAFATRPTIPEWRAFWSRLLHGAGLGSLGAGLVFFVAANWPAWGLAGRFGLLQAGLLACVGAALWRPPPGRPGKAALMSDILITGALLALFGQSYQTGASLYELFLAWAALALPFAVAAQWGAAWAAWWVVLDAGLALLCGVASLDRALFALFDGWLRDRGLPLMLACGANLLGAGLFVVLRRSRFAAAAPPWLARFLLGIGLIFGTAASLPGWGREESLGIVPYAALSAGIAWSAWRRRSDVFALTALAGSWIAISTAWLARSIRTDEVGSLFTVAVWLIASSTLSATWLLRCARAWRGDAVEGGVR